MTVSAKLVDFHQAARRHFNDAELLFNLTRRANAGHLYGFAAECGVKALLVWKGYPSDPVSGEIIEKRPNKFRVHIHDLTKNINMVYTFLDGRGAAKYLAMIPSIGDFSDWKTDHRYYIESELPPSVSSWRNASREIMHMLDQAMLDDGEKI